MGPQVCNLSTMGSWGRIIPSLSHVWATKQLSKALPHRKTKQNQKQIYISGDLVQCTALILVSNTISYSQKIKTGKWSDKGNLLNHSKQKEQRKKGQEQKHFDPGYVPCHLPLPNSLAHLRAHSTMNQSMD